MFCISHRKIHGNEKAERTVVSRNIRTPESLVTRETKTKLKSATTTYDKSTGHETKLT